MSLDILLSSSTGLVVDAMNNYFIQVIISEDEYNDRERHDLFIPIPKKEAMRISKQLSLEISIDNSTISLYNSDIVSHL